MKGNEILFCVSLSFISIQLGLGSRIITYIDTRKLKLLHLDFNIIILHLYFLFDLLCQVGPIHPILGIVETFKQL